MKNETIKYKKMSYILSKPDGFSESEKYPTIIFLHGAGTRGEDIEILKNNPYFKVMNKKGRNIITFAPQCYANSWFEIFEQLMEFVDFVIEHNFVNKEKVYLMGTSMGGYGAWQLAMSIPEKFAAVVPICGGGMYWNAARLSGLKIWAFHGDLDNVVAMEESKKMVDAVNKNGGDAKLTICEGVWHDSWMNAYESDELFEWLLSQSRGKKPRSDGEFNDQQRFG